MGFMGLKHWVESDNAADFHARLSASLNKLVKDELKNKANKYNTPGYVNVLLIFKETPGIVEFIKYDTLNAINRMIENDEGYLDNADGNELVRNFYSARYVKASNGRSK